MPAPEGNNYAEKWTKETVLQTLDRIEAEAKKPSCAWLGSALVKVGLYKDLWAYWKEKFEDDDEVFRPIKKIEQIFEDRLFEKALKGDYNQTMAIFGLKNNHEWRDRTEVERTERKVYENLTDEEIAEEIERLDRIAKATEGTKGGTGEKGRKK